MIFSWLRNRRRRRVLAQPFPKEWEELLQRRVRHYRYLPPSHQQRVRQIVPVMVAEKEWAAASDFKVTPEMAVTIAGQAAVMASGFDEPYFFDRLHTVVIHPKTIRFAPEQTSRNPNLPGGWLSGIAWHRGPVVLSWGEIRTELTGRSPGRNVILHEFAHYLDGLDGPADGKPPMSSKESERRWYAVTEAEYLRLVGSARRGEATLLDHYGASNRAEFFAVSTEYFFELPHQLYERHPDLYAVLQEFYHLDPRQWLPRIDSPRQDDAGDGGDYQRFRARRQRRSDVAQLKAVQAMAPGDALYALAFDHLHRGRPADAIRLFDQLLEVDPRDEESLAHRALAYLRLQRLAEARRDCEAALAIDPQDAEALWARGAVALQEGRTLEAVNDLSEAVDASPQNIEIRRARASAWMVAGRPQKAVADLTEALNIEPHDAELLAERARAYQALNRTADANRDIARAKLLEPELAWPA
ncbi:MAG: zinc-dependent peptidase [Planctomycetaceae bacterium]|nr:zinc-dependent peptidase [Planctomycetaceae bacterium]